jgi:acylphosphatase
MEKTFSVNFVGRVQGIGFRFLTMRKANSMGLTGWVKNAYQRDLVEAVFQGEEKKVNELIEYLKSNPFFVRVDNVSLYEIKNSEKFSDFQVKY